MRKRKNKGSIFVISAPSGAGKTTICKEILRLDGAVRQSVSFTTRAPREGEINDEDYTFIGEGEFRKLAGAGEFVEWAEVHGNLYGTSKRRLEEIMESGLDVLLDIDVQGARQIRKSVEGGVFIFILPPSMAVLRSRLEKRGSDAKEDVEKRLGRAVDEIRDFTMYDYVIVNDRLRESVSGLKAIMTAERLRAKKIDSNWLKENFPG